MIEEISPSKGLLSKGAPFENFKYCMGNRFFEDFHVKKHLRVLGILFEAFFKKTIFKGFPPFECFHGTETGFPGKYSFCYSHLIFFLPPPAHPITLALIILFW